jgi:uncharacterized membrane protein YjjP (DUF1212 family)
MLNGTNTELKNEMTPEQYKKEIDSLLFQISEMQKVVDKFEAGLIPYYENIKATKHVLKNKRNRVKMLVFVFNNHKANA